MDGSSSVQRAKSHGNLSCTKFSPCWGKHTVVLSNQSMVGEIIILPRSTTLVPPPWEGKCWSNCSMLRKEQQKWLKSRSTVPEGRSLFSSNIRHHFHSLCKTGVVASKWLLGFLLTSYIPRAAAEKDSQIQNILRKRRKKPAINHTPDVHSAFRYRWRMTSLFIWKNLGGHPPPSITLITYFNHDIKKLLLAVRGQFIFHVRSVSGSSEEAKCHRADQH